MYRLFVSVLMFCFIVISACKNDDPIGISELPSIVKVKLAEKWKPNAQDLYKIETTITDPQGIENVKTVIIDVKREQEGGIIYQDTLFDDGAYLHPQDGDVFAGDGIFTNRFSTDMIDPGVNNGMYVFSFKAVDQSGNQSGVVEKLILFSDNAPPEITEVVSPDTFSVLLQDQLLMVTVTDTNGQIDIQRVYFESRNITTNVIKIEGDLYDDGDWENHGDLNAGDSVFSARLDAGIAIGKKGDFELLFGAEDKFGETGVAGPAMIYINNLNPEFGILDVPESLNRPAPGTSTTRTLITAEVLDPEGLADLDSVYFYSRKPDQTFANNGQPIILRDNGLPFDPNNPAVAVGDAQAGDGIYSFSLILDPGTQLGTYQFSFYIRDKAGNLSPVLLRELTILPSE